MLRLCEDVTRSRSITSERHVSTALIEPFNFLGRCAWFVARYENTRYNSRRYYNNNISIFQEVRAFETQTSFDREEENYYFPSPTPSNFITFSPSLHLSFSMFTACRPIIVMAAECALYFIIFFTKHFEQGGEKRKAVPLKYLRFSSPRLDRSQSRLNKGSLSLLFSNLLFLSIESIRPSQSSPFVNPSVTVRQRGERGGAYFWPRHGYAHESSTESGGISGRGASQRFSGRLPTFTPFYPGVWHRDRRAILT